MLTEEIPVKRRKLNIGYTPKIYEVTPSFSSNIDISSFCDTEGYLNYETQYYLFSTLFPTSNVYSYLEPFEFTKKQTIEYQLNDEIYSRLLGELISRKIYWYYIIKNLKNRSITSFKLEIVSLQIPTQWFCEYDVVKCIYKNCSLLFASSPRNINTDMISKVIMECGFNPLLDIVSKYRSFCENTGLIFNGSILKYNNKLSGLEGLGDNLFTKKWISDMNTTIDSIFSEHPFCYPLYPYGDPYGIPTIRQDDVIKHKMAWLCLSYKLKYKSMTIFKLFYPHHFKLGNDGRYHTELQYNDYPNLIKFVRSIRKDKGINDVSRDFIVSIMIYDIEPLLFYGFPLVIRKRITDELGLSPLDHLEKTNGNLLYYHTYAGYKIPDDKLLRAVELINIDRYLEEIPKGLNHDELYKYTWMFPDQEFWEKLPLELKAKVGTLFEKKMYPKRINWSNIKRDIYFDFK